MRRRILQISAVLLVLLAAGIALLTFGHDTVMNTA